MKETNVTFKQIISKTEKTSNYWAVKTMCLNYIWLLISNWIFFLLLLQFYWLADVRTATPSVRRRPLQFVRNCLDQIPTFAQRSALNPCVRCPVENAVRTINYFKNKVLTWSVCVLHVTILRWYSIKWLSLVKNSSFYNVFLSTPLYFYLKVSSCKVYH